jgi:hypothetical protein
MFPGGSMSSHPGKQPLEVRIERLERQNRLFRRGALTCLIAVEFEQIFEVIIKKF